MNTSPVVQLELSRERLRQAIRSNNRPRRSSSVPGERKGLAGWLEHLHNMPGMSVALDAARTMWARHPLHTAASIGSEAARTLVNPLAQRHPLLSVLGAFVVGGLFAWSRPWRWILTPALLAGLLPRMLARSVSHVPASVWVSLLNTLLRNRTAADKRTPSPYAASTGAVPQHQSLRRAP